MLAAPTDQYTEPAEVRLIWGNGAIGLTKPSVLPVAPLPLELLIDLVVVLADVPNHCQLGS